MDRELSLDVDYLENRLTQQLERLQPLSRNRCVYRVPPVIRNSDKRLFTPKMVSIGPFHYGQHQGLQAMEVRKRRYLKDFCRRAYRSMKDLVVFIRERERQLRDCYSETVQLESDDFVEMILVDAAFIIEHLLRIAELQIYGEESFVDPILDNPRMISYIQLDLFLLENQLPMFILRDLFEMAKRAIDPYDSHQLSMPNLIYRMWSWECLLIEEESIKKHFPEAEHFVDLTRRCLEPTESYVCPLRTLTIPSVTELHETGVNLGLGSKNRLLDIRFNNGVLEIPKLKMVDRMEDILRNLQVFEILHCKSNYVNDYMIMMNYLVNKPEDVDLLVNNGVLENWLWNGEAVSNIFQTHVKGGNMTPWECYYSGLIRDLNTYSKSPLNKWKAKKFKWTENLKQNYFSSPWTIISVIAATILLILTFLQTLYSMKK